MRDKDGWILLVEDNADDELLTLRAFKKNNLKNEVRVVRDGAEALEVLFGSDAAAPGGPGAAPAMILLDLKLPKVDGFEVLRRVRCDPRTVLVPVIVLTSSKNDEDLDRCYRLGANSYIRKPVDFDDFVAAVARLGNYWLLLNEMPPRSA